MKTDAYYETKAPNYGMSAGRLQHILDLMPTTSGSVLDIGCAGGILARALQERAHQFGGVNISREAILVAQPYLERGFVFDVADQDWPEELTIMKFDTIVASEIIEHLFDPEQFLKKFRRLMAPGGKIIITTPNFLFWKNRFRMLLGRFCYEKEGLLDFGHIRFFTVIAARESFAKSGLSIEQEHHYYPNLEHRGMGKLGQYLPGLFAYQLIFLLSNEKNNGKLKFDR